MDEAEWLRCTDPYPMLAFVKGKASERKLRLFALASCRRIWHLLTDERLEKAVQVADQFADGLCAEEALNFARIEASKCRSVRFEWWNDCISAIRWATYPDHYAEHSAESAAFARRAAIIYSRLNTRNKVSEVVESAAQCDLLRDIFGTLPFGLLPSLGPAVFAWNGGRMKRLAESVYEERGFDCLPILADALEDAGCTDTAILAHCRSSGPHVRGCWLIDLLSGKE